MGYCDISMSQSGLWRSLCESPWHLVTYVGSDITYVYFVRTVCILGMCPYRINLKGEYGRTWQFFGHFGKWITCIGVAGQLCLKCKNRRVG